MRHADSGSSEDGAALVSVLVVLVVMSGLMVAMLDGMRFAMQRTANEADLVQSRWYQAGAETYAAHRLEQALGADPDRFADPEGLLGRVVELPTDTGLMRLMLRDATNCFNLNAVVERQDDGTLVGQARMQTEFARLLVALGEAPARAEQLTASLTDWLDSDSSALPGGAEDDHYGDRVRPHLAPGLLLADVAELARIEGFDPGIIDRLAPLACALPDERATTPNIHTLTPAHAPFLVSMVGPALTPGAAAEALRRRPGGGWPDAPAFVAALGVVAPEEREGLASRFGTRSDAFILVSDIRHATARTVSTALLEVAGTGRVNVVRRLPGGQDLGGGR
jgi:general secretion pathway protein K